MHRSLRTLRLLAAVVLSLSVAWVPPASACMLASAHNGVRTNGEEVLIVWDQARHREHFLRSISFNGVTEPFGFIVPTPTRPELAEFDDSVFTDLEQIYSVDPAAVRGVLAASGAEIPATARLSAVRVVEQTHVAGMDATVLTATDARALAAWLAQHHFPAPAGMTEYLAGYVRDGWYLTAFRYAPAAGNRLVRSKVVRMSFDSHKPFFPYAEPSSQSQAGNRSFRVSVLSSARMEAVVYGRPWSGIARYAGQSAAASALAHRVASTAQFGEQAWITTFHEARSVRGAHDLYFRPAQSQEPLPSSIERGSRPISVEASTRVNSASDPWGDE